MLEIEVLAGKGEYKISMLRQSVLLSSTVLSFPERGGRKSESIRGPFF